MTSLCLLRISILQLSLLHKSTIVSSTNFELRIDTSGGGVKFVALFH